MQPPPGTPPQWSADGQWWWDGWRWRHRNETSALPAPGYAIPQPPPAYGLPPTAFQMPPPVPVVPSPGLRIFLIVVLSLTVLITGLFSLFGVLGVSANVAAGTNDLTDALFVVLFLAVFAVELLALVGVSIRASWSRWAAIVAGIAISLSCLGAVLGIPILVAAARAPDLSKNPGQPAS